MYKAAPSTRRIYERTLADNEGYEMFYYDDAACDAFMHAQFAECTHTTQCGCARVWEAYRRLKPGAFRADLFRYAHLYLYGGVWSDLTQDFKVPLTDLVSDDDDAVIVRDKRQGNCMFRPGVQISFMCAPAGAPLMHAFMVTAVDNILRGDYGACPLAITGPVSAAKALRAGDFRYRCELYQASENFINSRVAKDAMQKPQRAIACRSKDHRAALGLPPETTNGAYNSDWANRTSIGDPADIRVSSGAVRVNVGTGAQELVRQMPPSPKTV